MPIRNDSDLRRTLDRNTWNRSVVGRHRPVVPNSYERLALALAGSAR